MGTGSFKDYFGTCYLVNQQPIWFYMAFPPAFIVPDYFVVFIISIKAFFIYKLFE